MRTIDIRFDAATHRLSYGLAGCLSCGNHTDKGIPAGQLVAFGSKPCDKCRGTGRRGSGWCRECRRYATALNNALPAGQVPDYTQPYAAGECRECRGTGTVPATDTDSVPAQTMAGILAVVPVRVLVQDRYLSWGEAFLGTLTAGVKGDLPMSIMTCQDYGRAWKLHQEDPAALVDKINHQVRTDRIQACKLTHDGETVVREIVAFLTRDGYTLQGVPAHIQLVHSDDAATDTTRVA